MTREKPLHKVSLLAKRKNFIMNYTNEFQLKGLTDAQGNFELRHAPAGEYEIQGRLEDPNRALFLDLANIRVDAALPEAAVQMRARAGSLLKGKFISTHKLRLSGRQMFVSVTEPQKSDWEAVTGADGSFAIALPTGSQGLLDFVGISGYTIVVKYPEKLPFLRLARTNLYFIDIPPGVHEGVEVHFYLSAKCGGTVRDGAGKPLAGLNVAVQPTGHVCKTDANGEYNIDVAPLQQVTLEVRDASSRQKIFMTEPFQAGEGEVLRKDITLGASTTDALTTSQKMDNAIIGRVVTTDGKPAAGVTIFLGNSGVLTEEHGTPTWRDGTFRPAFLTADAKGAFTFNVLRPGKTDLWAEDPKLGRGWVRDVSTDALDVKIVLRPKKEGPLTVGGTLLAPGGKAAAGAWLGLFSGDNSEPVLIAQGRSDAAGRFRLKGTPPPNSPYHILKLLCLAQGGGVAWKVLPYCPADDLKIQFKPAARLTGRVVDKNGHAIRDAKVNYYQAVDPDYGSTFFNGTMKTATPAARTDAGGRFTLGGFPVGSRVDLIAKHLDYGRENAWNIPVNPGANTIPDIILPDGITVTGTVRHAETNLPAANTTVTLDDSSREDPAIMTNARGEFVLKGIDKRISNSPLNLTAQGGGNPPAWEGEARVDRAVQPGEHLAGVEIVVRKSLAVRRAEWRALPGKPAASKARVAVLDDTDPGFNSKEKYLDTLSVYAATGKRIWTQGGFNTCQSVSASHALIWNPADKSLWSVEEAASRMQKFDGNGKRLLHQEYPASIENKPGVYPSALAADPKTGNLWALFSNGTIYGKSLQVLDLAGHKLQEYPLGAGDIAYSPHDDCFWLVGKKISKIGRDGKVLYQSPNEAAWLWGAVAVSSSDGSVWVAERRHPQVRGSRTRVLVLDAAGKLRQEIPTEGEPFSIALDDRRSCAWIATTLGVLKTDFAGRPLAQAPLKAYSIGVEPDTGCVWVGAREGIYRLDPEGRMIWCDESSHDSQKWVTIIHD